MEHENCVYLKCFVLSVERRIKENWRSHFLPPNEVRNFLLLLSRCHTQFSCIQCWLVTSHWATLQLMNYFMFMSKKLIKFSCSQLFSEKGGKENIKMREEKSLTKENFRNYVILHPPPAFSIHRWWWWCRGQGRGRERCRWGKRKEKEKTFSFF